MARMDEICGFREINAFYARCADPKELVIIDGSDHLFNGVVSEVAVPSRNCSATGSISGFGGVLRLKEARR